MSAGIKWLSWLAGVAGVLLIVGIFPPANLREMMEVVGVRGVAALVALTLMSRWVQTATTVLPMRTMGFEVRHLDAFWMGWLRTFANQVVPSAGVAAYAQALRYKTAISWSELAALASPQFLLVASALGLLGLVAVAVNIQLLGPRSPELGIIYALVLVFSLLIARGATSFVDLFPAGIVQRLERVADSFHKFAQTPNLIATVVACHTGAILLRGGRLWLLVAAAGICLDWREALLLAIVAESSLLIQLTPGGLGIREGAVLVAATLLNIPIEVAASVAVFDRLLVVSLTALLTPPAIVFLRRRPVSHP